MLRAEIIGRVGGDPELVQAASGNQYLKVNVASNYRARVATGTWEDRTEWVKVTVYGQRATYLAEHLRKGELIYASGRLEASPWTTRDGDVRAGLCLFADTVELTSSRPRAEAAPTAAPVAAGRRPSGGQRLAAQMAAEDGDDLDQLPW